MTAKTYLLETIVNRINRISRGVNELTADDSSGIRNTLLFVAESVAELVPGSGCVIYQYDPLKNEFERESRIFSGEEDRDLSSQIELAQRALWRKQPVLNGGAVERSQASEACFPLFVSGEMLGGLYCSAAGFSEVEWALLEQMAAQAGMILFLARQWALAQQGQARRERDLRRLRRAGMLISSRSSLKDTLDSILKMALEVTDASYGIFRLVDTGGSNLVTQAFAGVGLANPATEALPITDGSVMGTVALKREPVVISDLREEPWRKIYYPFDHALEMRSEIALPLIGASGRLEGVLNLESPEVDAFDREDRYILQILATQAVVAIEGIRLLDALQDISAMLYTRSLQQIHQALVERACDLLNLPTSLIWLLEKDEIVIQAASETVMCCSRIGLGSDPISRVIQTGEPLILLNAGSDPSFYEGPLAGLQGKGSALIVPLFTSDGSRPAGAFSVFTASGDTRDFAQSDWNKKVLNILGHYAALAIQNTVHLEALKFAEDQRATTETFAAIGDIAANLLHRLNNKIGTIPVRVEGIEDKCGALIQNDPYLVDNLTEIQRSAAEAMQVVRESLDHLRPIQLAPVSVAACVQDAIVSIVLPQGVELDCADLDSLPPVQAGANRLTLVFSNLLDNAIDAMKGQGKIRLQGQVIGNWVEVRVGDTGPGIPADLHERIFEFSYSASTSTHPGKLGFGLWWVKSLMTRFGGKVTLESERPGGTTFILSLPVAREEA